MASAVVHVEQFADTLYREAVTMQDEYIEQLSVAAHHVDTLNRNWLSAEDHAPRLVAELQISKLQTENAARKAGEAYRANQQLEITVGG